MDLPLVDEIREARRLAEQATDASMQLIGIGVALQAIGMIEGHLARTPDPDVPIPGEELVDQLVDRWPALADLHAHMPPPNASYLARLQARRAQIDAARQVLKPLAGEQNAHAQRLAQLQREQRQALLTPRYAADVAALNEISTARERVARELQPVSRLLSLLTPTIIAVTGFEARLAESLEEARGDDPHGHRAWRAAHVAHGLLQGLAATLDSLSLGIDVPTLPPPPAQPDEVAVEELRERVAAAVDTVRSLRVSMEHEAARVQRESADLTATLDRLTRQLVDRMG